MQRANNLYVRVLIVQIVEQVNGRTRISVPIARRCDNFSKVKILEHRRPVVDVTRRIHHKKIVVMPTTSTKPRELVNVREWPAFQTWQ